VSRWTIKSAEFTVSYTDIGIVKDDVIDERYRVAKHIAPQDVCYKAHRINIVRFDQSDAIVEAELTALKCAVKNITNL
jgi:hypothetical protein